MDDCPTKDLIEDYHVSIGQLSVLNIAALSCHVLCTHSQKYLSHARHYSFSSGGMAGVVRGRDEVSVQCAVGKKLYHVEDGVLGTPDRKGHPISEDVVMSKSVCNGKHPLHSFSMCLHMSSKCRTYDAVLVLLSHIKNYFKN
ncbi:hypothetical protein PR048_020737 [Dryococelus australis]|uniref:Uncharacterized protein n=1 Tax=Dryococelus australis TaxID=614101 RepID=A0ABQ9H715_9NEOP|nr:hypothetical protein PR048_020737 [Dryococelus australis]